MNHRSIRTALMLSAAALFHVLMLGSIEERLLQRNCFSYETAFAAFRDHAVPEEVLADLWEAGEGELSGFSELLTMYFASDGAVTDPAVLQKDAALAKTYHAEEFETIAGYVTSVWGDLSCFPVGETAADPDATVTFSDSWMQSRTFGGERGHEGCDIMATVNTRGIYPVYSITDGVVEKIGWLKLGGYRIGIRSPSGAYFYYAHLAEYAKEFAIGEPVQAGTFLGYMGDTGYSEVPGTTGRFDVHLHLGIYLNDAAGNEFSVNSYPMLRYLWKVRKAAGAQKGSIPSGGDEGDGQRIFACEQDRDEGAGDRSA